MPYLGLRGIRLVLAISFTAGVSFCLFGIDNAALGGVISSVPFERQFNLSPTAQGAVTGSYELGCFASALTVSALGDRFSRRATLLACIVPLMIGAALQVSAFGVAQLTVGRVVAGLGMGGITSITPVWQNETSPAHLRGTLMCVSLSLLIVGQLIGYWAAYGLLANYPEANLTWRIQFSLQAMAGILLALCLFFMPESPRWLLARDKPVQATRVLAALADLPEDDPQVLGQVEEISRAIQLERRSARSWGDLFRSSGDAQGEKRRMLTSVVIQVMQAFSGSTIISYYVTTIFQTAIGLTPHVATLLSGFLQVFFLIASIGTWWLIEHAGRRNLFLITAFGMGVVMFIMGGMIKIDTYGSGIAAAAMVFCYQALFTWGWMAGVWVYSSEINPLSWRSKGMGLAVALQWLFDFVLIMVTPIGIANIGYGMFMLFGAFNFCFIPFVWLYCPETAGLPLESIDALYLPGVDPVSESRRLRTAMKRGKRGGGAEEAISLGRISAKMVQSDERDEASGAALD